MTLSKSGMLLSVFILFPIHATQFEVRNMTSYRFIDVDPIWKGNVRGFRRCEKALSYDSGIHVVREIMWRMPTGWCWKAKIEDKTGAFADRFRKGVCIKIYDDGYVFVDLTTQCFKRGNPSTDWIKAQKGNC